LYLYSATPELKIESEKKLPIQCLVQLTNPEKRKESVSVEKPVAGQIPIESIYV
jgi:hypothetical protein